jgi:ADP-ribosylglycohydrolase
MLGALAGDIIGSIYERNPIKTKEFPLFLPSCHFTDDSVLTIAIAQAILQGQDYQSAVWTMGRKYPDAGYGGTFIRWLTSLEPKPYNSWGNGSAMRVSPIAYAFTDVEEVLHEAARSATITHNHPEGIKGAQAIALAIFLAKNGSDKNEIRHEISNRFGYDLTVTVDRMRPTYDFDVSCQGTVPAALIAFLDADSYEDAVRNAVSLGGDSDTLASISGGIAEAYYGTVPFFIQEKVKATLTDELWQITRAFSKKYGVEAEIFNID